jgi:hypothetical protein
VTFSSQASDLVAGQSSSTKTDVFVENLQVPRQGFVLTSNQPGSAFGAAVAGVGDFNGDGIADFAIGAPGELVASGGSYGPAGRIYIVYGSPNLTSETVGGASNAQFTGSIFSGGDVARGLGSRIASAGDVNGDGLSDVVIGSEGSNSFVLFGSRQPLTTAPIGWPFGYEIKDASTGSTGTSVSGLGDFNGDGIPDIGIGANGISM